ncbi:MAG TPA: nucleoside hydrolase [Chthoniobacterales bacterium]|nr:nucleoside hydrolase [Chthoniobacterales bacterium]
MKKRRTIVFTDMMEQWGDDSSALLLLLRSPDVDIRGIVAESGNEWVDDVDRHVREFLRLANREDIPVLTGLPKEAHRQRYEQVNRGSTADSGYFFGAFRNADVDWSSDLTELDALARERVARLVDAINLNDDNVTLVVLSPCTTLAAALQAGVDQRVISKVYMMGGCFDVPGNSSSTAEFNIWFDPTAASAIIGSSLPVTLVPLDATRGNGIASSYAGTFDASGNRLAGLVADYLRRKQPWVQMWDEVVAGVMLSQSLILERVAGKVNVEIGNAGTVGRTTIVGDGDIEIIKSVDDFRMRRLFTESVLCAE